MSSRTGEFARTRDFVRFDILEVARRCGIPIMKKTPGGEWGARCPFCGDSQNPQHFHLYLEPEKGLYYCHRCGENGNVIELYAAMRGVDTKTAYRELAGATYQLPEIRFDPSKIIKIQPEENIAPVEKRDAVYRLLLELLPLLPHHRADLLRRGLSEAVIQRNAYRSLPARPENRLRISGELAKRCDPSGVPGFYINEAGNWDMVSAPGYLIPVRDPKGLIQGMQVRLDNVKNGHKYVWFSSRGRKGGCGAKVWVHVADPIGKPPEGRVWLTEGPLKADAAACFLGVRFLGVPGATAWSNVLETAKGVGAKEVVIAYDADQKENPVVKKAADGLAQELKENGLAVVPAEWPPEMGKGIDDVCVTLTKERKVVTEAYFLEGVKVTRTRTVTETVKIEGYPSPSLLEKAAGWLKKMLK
jgi:hypothetical protein